MLLLTAYSLYTLYYMINRLSPSITKTTMIRPSDEEEPFRPQDVGFDFAFGLGSDLDPSIGFFTAKYIN